MLREFCNWELVSSSSRIGSNTEGTQFASPLFLHDYVLSPHYEVIGSLVAHFVVCSNK
jgi:hypothetical protein